eukprot:CAMPEP_0194287078 /NCGR_PEP_ID=MMETSP0169-20130528/33964_1 /TAXON_ID=218684 /ORGANISM="Corethron pennatum, Strain L29A3" /LENGTH=332 /DNA_ID=CAMNT_0039033667 /DNA_START=41 /DNA_END=1039 /DNA_ORIENTATION=+
MSKPQHATPRTFRYTDGSPSHGRWTVEEHRLFLQGLEKYGDNWNEFTFLIHSRTLVQIRTHGQKYLKKLMKARCHDRKNHFTLSKKRIRSSSKQRIKSIVHSAEKQYKHDRTVVTTTAACKISITEKSRLSALPSSVTSTPFPYINSKSPQDKDGVYNFEGFPPNSDAHNADQLRDTTNRLHTLDGMTSDKFLLSQHARNTLESVSSAFNTTVASSAGVTSRVPKQPGVLRNQEKCPPKRVDDILFLDLSCPSSFEKMSEVDELLHGIDIGQALPTSAALDTFEWTTLDNSGGLKTSLRMPVIRDKANTNSASIPGFDIELILDAPLSVPGK